MYVDFFCLVCESHFFVDKLYTIQPGENESYLPSPEALREKILVKVSAFNYCSCCCAMKLNV